MSTPVLATKLYLPPSRPKVVFRSRLIERLNEGLDGILTLLSAPAGFGKTTLVSEWVTAPRGLAERPVAWLSLDEGDNDPTRFLAYFVTALQTIAPDLGKGVLGALHSPQPPRGPSGREAMLTALINEIATIPDDFVLVLDDYHVLDAKPVNDALIFVLEHLPPQMHLVITTREDPQLPLARYRARGQLTELRATDLRFTPDEAAKFLIEIMGLDLSAEEVASLEGRTEGWIAGLQLAALALQGTLSMRGREDVARFIRAFAGEHRYIVDYLVEEVLQRQPERVRSFLLQTSILSRLSGPLCNAVTGQEEGNARLEALERGNLFVVPLDDTRHWYRYHHLFADVLRAHLMQEQPDRVPTLHRRASEWYAQNDMPSDAIRHALAAADFEWAADLVERAWSAMDRSRQSATWLRWVKALPDELVRARPVLSVGYAWALLDGGEMEAAEARLQDAERCMGTSSDGSEEPEDPSTEMVVVDEEEFRSLPATIAAARAYHALALGDVPSTVTYARQALDLLPEGDYLRRGIPASILGLAYWASGELEAAHRSFADAMASFQMAGNVLFAITGTHVLADIQLAQGRLQAAVRTYQQSLQLATELDEPVLWGTADLHTRLSELYCEQNDLAAATQHLLRSEELGEQALLPRWRYRWCVAQACIEEAQGELDDAIDLLDEAARLYVRGPVPDVRPIAALKARVWVAQGRLAEALEWTREQGLPTDDDLSYLREFEHITLSRLLIARYKSEQKAHLIEESMTLLDRLLRAAEAGGRMGSVIEILILQALAHAAKGNIPLALAPLERALTLAEPEGYARLFVNEGAPMAHLLSAAAARGIAPDYTGRLLAAFPDFSAVPTTQSKIRNPKSAMVESLSERELEILQLVAQGLSNREIGERLFLALSTVKGHNRNIFGKLQVQRRTEAVACARELGLL